MSQHINELRGAQRLVEDAVHHGSNIVETIQKETAQRTFSILEKIPVVAPVSQLVQGIFNATVSLSHGGVRLVNKAVHRTIDVALEQAEEAVGGGE